jgi:protein-tyrosine phosphatase
MSKKLKIVFVCLGNICRSPMAEGVFLNLIADYGLQDQIEVDSAGTGAYHIGDLPDPRTRSNATGHGITLISRARQFKKEDFNVFDYVIAMDASNLSNVLALTNNAADWPKVVLLRNFDSVQYQGTNVPDPYYGSEQDFEEVYQICLRCCQNFLDSLVQVHGLKKK